MVVLLFGCIALLMLGSVSFMAAAKLNPDAFRLREKVHVLEVALADQRQAVQAYQLNHRSRWPTADELATSIVENAGQRRSGAVRTPEGYRWALYASANDVTFCLLPSAHPSIAGNETSWTAASGVAINGLFKRLSAGRGDAPLAIAENCTGAAPACPGNDEFCQASSPRVLRHTITRF